MITGTIVLEGGATRGVFTSGILDYLMEEDLYFSHVIGVSAGSCNGVDYVSRQIGRTKKCMIPEKKEYSYYSGVRSAIKEKSILDMDMVFDTFPKKIYPFDFETYFQSDMVCEIVTTNCETGKAEYMTEQSDPDRLMKLCRASSSMPLLSPIVNIDGVPYLDGGLADSVPIRRALQSGNEKIVLVAYASKTSVNSPSLVAAGMIHERKSVALLSGIEKQKNSFRQISIWTLLSSYWFYPEKDIP